MRRSIDDWRRSGACVLWTWMLFAACAGPRLAIGRPPDAGACHLDGRVLTAGAVPLPYYGTAVLDAFPAPGDGGPREFERLPARVAVPMPEPTSPWLFPLDLPLEALARLFSGPGDRAAMAVLTDNPALAVAPEPAAPQPLPGAGPLRARVLSARVQR